MNQTSSQTTKQSTGVLGGPIVKNGVPKGNYEVKLVGITNAKWTGKHFNVNATITLNANGLSLKPGIPIHIELYERDSNKPDSLLETLKVMPSGDQISAQWKYNKTHWTNAKKSKRPSCPSYYFICKTSYSKSICRSGLIHLTTDIKINLLDENGKGASGQSYEIILANGEIKSGTTDSNGKITVPNVPIGLHFIKFPGNSLIGPDKATKVEDPYKIVSYPIDPFEECKMYSTGYLVKCKHTPEKHHRFVLNPTEFTFIQDPPTGKDEPDTISIYTLTKSNPSEKSGKQFASVKEGILKVNNIDLEHFEKITTTLPFHPDFWKELFKKTEYEIQGLYKPLKIIAYPSDQFQLSLNVPTPERFEVGSKLLKSPLKNIKNAAEAREKKLGYKFDYNNNISLNSDQWGTLKHPLAIGSTKRPITYKVNNRALQIQSLDAFSSILLVVQKFRSIKDMVYQSIPKAGWYFDCNVAALEGVVGLKWGWKEYLDHQAYMGIAASLDVKILSVELEIGVGFSSWQIVGQLYASVAGEIGTSINAERTSPSMAPQIKIPIKASIQGSIGVRVKVTALVKANLIGTTGFEGSGNVNIGGENIFKVELTFKWTGLKAKVSASAGVGQAGGDKKQTGKQASAVSGEKEWVFVDEKEMGTFSFPGNEQYKPSYLTTEQIVNVFKKVLTKDVRFKIVSNNGSEYSLDNAISEMVKLVNDSGHIDRSERSMEALALDARQCLQSYGSTLDSDVCILSKDDFNFYCYSGKYQDSLAKLCR